MTEQRPIGMRVPRPYDTEEEFIQGDGLAIGRMGMILIGAPARAPGIVMRFELLLRSGEPVFRGEGKVIAHRIHANGRQGLEVRFTRLDKHSKALVERVLELRKAGKLAAAPMPGSAEAPDSGGESPRMDAPAPVEEAANVEARESDSGSAAAVAHPVEPIAIEPPAHAEPAHGGADIHEPTAPEPALAQPKLHEGEAEEHPEAVLEPDATVVDARVEEVEAAASRSQPVDASEEEDVVAPAPIDQEATPFVPPVAFDDHVPAALEQEQESGAQQQAAQPEPASARRGGDELARLRARSAVFQASADTRSALGRLRARLHS